MKQLNIRSMEIMETTHKELMYAIDKFRELYGVKQYTMDDLEKIIKEKREEK